VEPQVRAFLSSLEAQNRYSKNTCLGYASDLRYFLDYLEHTLGRSPSVEDFNDTQVANFIASEHRIGRQRNTLYRRRATLRQFSNFLQRQGVIEVNFLNQNAQRIEEIISGAPPSARDRCLTEDQIERLMEALNSDNRPQAGRDHALIAILLETGLTVTNLVELNLSDLDLTTEHVHLRLDDHKSLWIPLRSAGAILNRYLNEGRPDLNCPPGEPALFISQLGKRLSRQGVWQIFRHWGQRANFSETLSPRRIRHTAALHLARDGRPINEIQTLLGHNNILSTHALLRRLKRSCSEE
jgi:integrase/recombinase XerD